jgi:hypothetical protein
MYNFELNKSASWWKSASWSQKVSADFVSPNIVWLVWPKEVTRNNVLCYMSSALVVTGGIIKCVPYKTVSKGKPKHLKRPATNSMVSALRPKLLETCRQQPMQRPAACVEQATVVVKRVNLEARQQPMKRPAACVEQATVVIKQEKLEATPLIKREQCLVPRRVRRGDTANAQSSLEAHGYVVIAGCVGEEVVERLVPCQSYFVGLVY